MLKVNCINLSMRIPKKIMFQFFFLKVSFSFSKDIKETVRGRDEYSLILVITDFINQLKLASPWPGGIYLGWFTGVPLSIDTYFILINVRRDGILGFLFELFWFNRIQWSLFWWCWNWTKFCCSSWGNYRRFD